MVPGSIALFLLLLFNNIYWVDAVCSTFGVAGVSGCSSTFQVLSTNARPSIALFKPSVPSSSSRASAASTSGLFASLPSTIRTVGASSTAELHASKSTSLVVKTSVSFTSEFSSDASQSSNLIAFASNAPPATTFTDDSGTQIWTRSIFSDLTTITAPITTTRAVAVTNSNGQVQSTSAAIIIGPGGVWWSYGGGGGGGGNSPCIWPFCYISGGGGGGGSGSCLWPFCSSGGGGGDTKGRPTTDGKKPTTVKSDDPTTSSKHDTTSTSESSQSASSTKTSSSVGSSLSCSASNTVSDCSITCSTVTSASSISCTTKCFSTFSGCDVTAFTSTTTASGCTKVSGWANVSNGPWLLTDVPASTTLSSLTTTSSSASSDSTSFSVRSSISKASPSLATSARAISTSKTPINSVQCVADGAPWYEPTSWCDCGSSRHYPTLPPRSGQSTANCAYTSLPASTINPTTTSAAPTNIPGQGGIPECLPVRAFAGTAAYCNCNASPAPTLQPTSSGIINCNYSLLPTSVYIPPVSQSSHSTLSALTTLRSVIQASSTTSQAPAFATGWCGLHVIEGHGSGVNDPPIALQVVVKDANGKTIQDTGAKAWSWGNRFEVNSVLPNSLYITPNLRSASHRAVLRRRTLIESGGDTTSKPSYETSSLNFQYGQDQWLQTDSSHCSVGAWDEGNFGDFLAQLAGFDFIATRQLDCGFACAARTKRSTDRHGSLHDDNPEDAVVSSEHGWPGHGSSLIELQEQNQSSVLEKRVIPRSENFQNAAKKGLDLWRKWQAKPVAADDKDLLCNLDKTYDIFEPRVTTSHPEEDLKDVMIEDGKDVASDYYQIILQSKYSAGKQALYTNIINPTAGIFLAAFNTRGTPKQPEDASAIFWWQWSRTVLASNEHATDFSGLTSLWRCSIGNDDTVAILEESMINVGNFIDQPVSFTPDNPDLNNPFWAILGTDNGKGIIFMLTDYKKSLKGKAITALKVQQHNQEEWNFWADIG